MWLLKHSGVEISTGVVDRVRDVSAIFENKGWYHTKTKIIATKKSTSSKKVEDKSGNEDDKNEDRKQGKKWRRRHDNEKDFQF